jgi:hypothetical protein
VDATPEPIEDEDGFRPYRAVYEGNLHKVAADDPAASEWIERAAAAWEMYTSASTDNPALEARLDAVELELHRVARRTGRNGDLRDARRLDIAKAVSDALGDRDLAVHFDLSVSDGRFAFERRDLALAGVAGPAAPKAGPGRIRQTRKVQPSRFR